MNAGEAIERALKDAVTKTYAPTCPPKLGSALRYAVFSWRCTHSLKDMPVSRGGLRWRR